VVVKQREDHVGEASTLLFIADDSGGNWGRYREWGQKISAIVVVIIVHLSLSLSLCVYLGLELGPENDAAGNNYTFYHALLFRCEVDAY
jgi:hypothetical protein